MIYLLLALLSLSSSGTVISQNIELVLDPDSRLLPIGRNATFTCKFRNVNENHHPYWKVNKTEATSDYSKGELMKKGFNILDDQEDGNGIMTLTLSVDSSYAGVNNTTIQCRTLTHIHSQIATILTIADPPFSPNPLLEQTSTSNLSLKWSPPFLWPGYYIRKYNISVRDDSGEKLSTYQVNSTTFSEVVMALSLNETYHICMEFSFEITPEHRDITGQSHYVNGGYYAPLGDHEFDVSAMVFFRADGTPLVRALVKPSDKICSYQELSIAINITDRASNALVTNNGPMPHRGNGSFEYDIASSNLKREAEYLMIIIVYTGFESSTFLYSFNTSLDPDLYPMNPSCISITGESRNGQLQNTQLFTYKVAMGTCLGLAALMLLTLGIVFICFLIHRQRRISQGKTLNVSTNRMQNAMVHNPIYDGPVYESVQPHFDTLTATVKQDLSLSNTSASNSPPRSSTPPNTGSSNNSQRMVRYLDQPIQLRSQSLSHPSTPDNNNPRSTSTVCAQSARVTGLKKNGKERNKLHLTLTLNGSESGNSTSGAPQCGKDEEVVLAGNLPGNPQGGNKKRAVVSDGDENYTVMSPIKRKDSGNIGGGVIELSPEDTIKYKEEVN